MVDRYLAMRNGVLCPLPDGHSISSHTQKMFTIRLSIIRFQKSHLGNCSNRIIRLCPTRGLVD